MKSLYEPAAVEEIRSRIARLRPDSAPVGKYEPGPGRGTLRLIHGMGFGVRVPERAPFPLRIVGRMIKPFVTGNEKPIRRNAPTAKELRVPDERDLSAESERLNELIDRFAAAGPKGCTTHPHAFFGRLTPEEWAILSYKHLDHHLRQFGV